jgi:hypothetical protein
MGTLNKIKIYSYIHEIVITEMEFHYINENDEEPADL